MSASGAVPDGRSGAAVVVAEAGFAGAGGERCSDAAALAAPGLEALPDGERGDKQADGRVQPAVRQAGASLVQALGTQPLGLLEIQTEEAAPVVGHVTVLSRE